MRWIHLTDLHVGKARGGMQATALNSLIHALRSELDGAIDAIFLTGDLVNSGTSEQYQEFLRSLLNPLRSVPECAAATVLAVPGNHDLDCDASEAITWRNLPDARRRAFFDESEVGNRVRSFRAQSFRAFATFCAEQNIIAPRPAQEVTRVHRVQTAQHTLRIALTNTSFFSNREPELTDQRTAPLPNESLRASLQAAEPADRTLVLGHHPVDWFREDSRAAFHSLLDSNGAVYLHGHLHSVQASFGPDGLRTFGFGAAYQGALADDNHPYRNSFTICELVDHELHTSITEWDTTHGRWVRKTSIGIEFIRPSSRLPGGYVLRLPQAPAASHGPVATHSEPPRRAPEISEIVTTAPLNVDAWRELIPTLGLPQLDLTDPNHLVVASASGPKFHVRQNGQVHYIDCTQGTGHVLSRSEVETASLAIDYEDLASYSVLTLGTIGNEAKTALVSLRRRRPIEVLSGLDIARRVLRTATQAARSRIDQLDAATSDILLVLGEGQPFLLVVDRLRGATFSVVDFLGQTVAESSPVVQAVRIARPSLANVRYQPTGAGAEAASSPELPRSSTEHEFDRQAYLLACKKEFNSARYTALAALGLRLPELPLEELYVEPSVDVGRQAAASNAVTRAVDELLQGLQLDAPLRAELESQVRRQIGLEPVAECGEARRTYQSKGSCLVLGDPGSGKTCFVKHEILEYCRQRENGDSWYGLHTPLFVPLAETARQFKPTSDLLEIACTLANRRGLPISLENAQQLASAGKLAVFFDGLDEIPSIGQRSVITDAISEFVESYERLGARIVITSRPSAIKLVELPSPLTHLYIRGLTEPEMRILGRRVLAARAHDGASKVSLDVSSLTSKDEALINELIEDTRSIKGIRRLATNPLFLTLLVMIYINHGRPSAKRHRVYQQAIQTLAAVRSRAAGQRPVSESDLRVRLGAIAVETLKSTDAVVPSRAAAREWLRSAMEKQRGASVTNVEADEYLQTVADATGLLVLAEGRTQSGEQEDTITFMHHSFLEYYAAEGLKCSLNLEEIVALSRQPRWHEAITLLAGLLADQGDVSELVSHLLQNSGTEETVTLERLLLAFDCALESDVPPERTQELLLSETRRVCESGPLPDDDELLAAFGERMGRLAASTSSELQTQFLLNGLRSASLPARSAAVRFTGYVASESALDDRIVEAFDACCNEPGSDVMHAICDAVGRAPPLRREKAKVVLQTALKGKLSLKFAGVRALEDAPALAPEFWDDLVSAVRKGSPLIGASAARALVNAGIRLSQSNPEQKRLLLDIVAALQVGNSPSVGWADKLGCTRAEVSAEVESNDRTSRLLGIRLLSCVSGDDQFVRDRLMAELRHTGEARREEQAAALIALRSSPAVHRLLRVSDVDVVRSFLLAESKDLRVAACRALGALGAATSQSAQIATDLLNYVDGREGDELRHAISALFAAVPHDPRVHSWALAELDLRLSRGAGPGTPRAADLASLLRACAGADFTASSGTSAKLLSACKNFRLDEAVRSEALLAVSNLSAPDTRTLQYLTDELTAPPQKWGEALPRAIRRFVHRCRRRIDYVRQISSLLPALGQALMRAHASQLASDKGRRQVGEFRKAVEDVQNVSRSYQAFADRMVVS